MEMLSRASLTLSEVEMAVILLVLSLFLLFSHSVDFAYIRVVTFHPLFCIGLTPLSHTVYVYVFPLLA